MVTPQQQRGTLTVRAAEFTEAEEGPDEAQASDRVDGGKARGAGRQEAAGCVAVSVPGVWRAVAISDGGGGNSVNRC